MKKLFLPALLTYLLVAVISFWGVWNIFFLQDAWSAFGKVLFAQSHGYDSLIRVYGFHFIPLAAFTMAALFSAFGTMYGPYAFFGITLHATNALLLAFLSYRLTGNRRIAGIAGLVFTVLNAFEQAVSQGSVSPATLPSATFTLLSCIAFTYFRSARKRRFLVAGSVSFLVALLYKEDALFLAAFIPVSALIIDRPQWKTWTAWSVGTATLYLFLRYMVMRWSPYTQYEGPSPSPILFTSLIKNLITVIPRAIPVLFVSQDGMREAGRFVLSSFHTILLRVVDIRHFGNNSDTYVENFIAPMVGYGIFATFLAAVSVFLKRPDTKKRVPGIWYGMAFLF